MVIETAEEEARRLGKTSRGGGSIITGTDALGENAADIPPTYEQLYVADNDPQGDKVKLAQAEFRRRAQEYKPIADHLQR